MTDSDCTKVVRFVHGLLRVSTISPTRTCRIMTLARTIRTIDRRFGSFGTPPAARERRVRAMVELVDIATHIGARLRFAGDSVVLAFANQNIIVPVVY